jgi:uncharacterized membrane protein YciS (DUF1049 family)
LKVEKELVVACTMGAFNDSTTSFKKVVYMLMTGNNQIVALCDNGLLRTWELK